MSDQGSMLFSPLALGTLTLKNRIVALPVFTGYAHTDGSVSPLLLEHYHSLAASGPAMVVVANAAVSSEGRTAKGSLRIDQDRFIPGLHRLARVIQSSGALACLQLNHAGRYAISDTPMLPSPADSGHLAFELASLKHFMESFPFDKRFGLTRFLMNKARGWQRGMDDEDRNLVLTEFGAAALRAQQAGFDLVELHGSSGYLLTQYLSGFTNGLGPPLGGSPEMRASFPLAVLDAVMAHAPGLPVGWRLLLQEWVPEGIDFSEASAFAAKLDDRGVAYLSCTAGAYTSWFLPEIRKRMAKPAYLSPHLHTLTQSTRAPTVISGRVIGPMQAEKLLRSDVSDLIGLARPLLADPQWIAKARDVKDPVKACINCNTCIKRVILNQGVACVHWPSRKKEAIDLEVDMAARAMFKTLVLAANPRDLRRLKSVWQHTLPLRHYVDTTVAFLQHCPADSEYQAAMAEFQAWSMDTWQSMGLEPNDLRFTTLDAVHERQEPDSLALSLARSQDRGVIVLCRRKEEKWRERLLHRHKFGIAEVFGTHPGFNDILVPFDLSWASLLVLKTLDWAFHGKGGFSFTFAHVLEGPKQAALDRWAEVLDILGWDPDTPLELLSERPDVTGALLHLLEDRNLGRVIMGKRGRSGLARLFLGSVSRGMAQGLASRSLTLIS
ncbi:MAG: hypothetical protein D6E12_06740 [Desulfovibrio sp.]|nr:MAG: hypothetical protein D6E12_06740 [Desulfovibrio sp.]